MIAVGRDPRMADPAGRLVEHLARGKLELVAQIHVPNDRQVLAARPPVRPLHFLVDLAGSDAAADADFGERSAPGERPVVVAVERDRHLAGLRDRKQVRADEAEDARLGAIRAGREELDRPSVPRRRVNHGLAVGREPRGVDLAAPERELLVVRRRDVARLLAVPVSGRQARGEGDQRGREAPARSSATASRPTGVENRTRLRRDARERLEVERDVARRLEPLLRVLLEAVAHDPVEAGVDFLVGLREVRRLLRQDRRDRVGRRVAAERALTRPASRRGSSRKRRCPTAGRPACRAPAPAPCSPSSRARRPAACRPRPVLHVGLAGLAALDLQLREAEVEDLDPPVLRQEQVLRLQVPVDDPLLVRRGESLRDLDGVVDRLADRERPGEQARPQRLALEQLRDDVRRVVVRPEVVDRRDVGVVEDARPPALPARNASAGPDPVRTTPAAP